MQSAGDFVGTFVEFAAGVQDGHDHLEGRAVLFLVHVHGNAAAVVLDGDAVVGVDADVYLVAVACQGFVDGIVDHLINQVVQAAEVDVADVHGGAHAHGFETFENGDVTSAVVVWDFCVIRR